MISIDKLYEAFDLIKVGTQASIRHKEISFILSYYGIQKNTTYQIDFALLNYNLHVDAVDMGIEHNKRLEIPIEFYNYFQNKIAYFNPYAEVE